MTKANALLKKIKEAYTSDIEFEPKSLRIKGKKVRVIYDILHPGSKGGNSFHRDPQAHEPGEAPEVEVEVKEIFDIESGQEIPLTHLTPKEKEELEQAAAEDAARED